MRQFLATHRSLVYALSTLILLILWLASGYLKSDTDTSNASQAASERSLIHKVRVSDPQAKRISQEIILNGRLEPARAVTLRSEIEGRVVELKADRGDSLQPGDLIAQFDVRDRQARLAEARGLLKQREMEYRSAQKLSKQQLQSEIQLAQAAAQLESARAQIAAIELEIRNTRIVAPFGGVLENLPVEIGAYLTPGDEVARVLELNPIVFTGFVSQQDRHRLVLGDRGILQLITGRIAEGEVRFIAAEADPVTRTYRVEVHVPNPDGSLVSGATAELRLPVRFISAIQVSPALLSLNQRDELGIKIVNAEDRVEFIAVKIIKSSADGMWISGLPENARIITVGQGFVRAGDTVVAVDEREIKSPE